MVHRFPPTRVLEPKRKILTRVGNDVEKLECSYIAAGNEKYGATLENSLEAQKVNSRITIGPNKASLRYVPKNVCLYTDLYMDIHSRIIHNSKRWKHIKYPPTDGGTNKCGISIQGTAMQP